MPTAYEQYLYQISRACDTAMNFEEEEKADQEDDSICSWYEMMGSSTLKEGEIENG